MSSIEPPPPGAEPDMDEFLDECIKDFKLSDTLQKRNDEDDDGNDSDASQKTVDFFTNYELTKQIKQEARSRSTSPVNTSNHPRIRPPEVDVKPDKRKLDERIERQRSRRSRSTSRTRSHHSWSQSSRDQRPRSRERSRDSRDKTRRRSPEREDRKSHIYSSRPSASSRRSPVALSPVRRPEHIGLRRRSRTRSRSRSRERRDRDRHDRHRISPKRRRIGSRDRSRSISPVRPAPRHRNDFLEEMMQKGIVSRDQAANVVINADSARAPVAPPVINPAAVHVPMVGVNPMVPPSLLSYNLHQMHSANPQIMYVPQDTREIVQERTQRAMIEEQVRMEMMAQQPQQQWRAVVTQPTKAKSSETRPAIIMDDREEAGTSTQMSLSDFLMTKTKGLPVAARSSASQSLSKEKVVMRCIANISALERYERSLQNAQFLQVPLAEPPEFVKISGRSPLIVNRHNVLYRTTSVSNNVDFSQPFKNISYKIGTIIKTVGLDPSEISRRIQEREEEDRRIMENRRSVKVERDSNDTMRNDIGVQTDETKCERCMLQVLKTYRSTASQKSTATVESCCQTTDMLAVQSTSVSNLTPAQLRIIDQLLQLMETDTTSEQLMRFMAGSFGRNNQNNWRQVVDVSRQVYSNGGGSNDGFNDDSDFELVNRSGPAPPPGFRETPQSNSRGQGVRHHPINSNLHNMLGTIRNNGRREAQQKNHFNNSFPSNRYYHQ